MTTPFRLEADLAYASSASQRLDLYRPPAGGEPFALVVYFHGGGWAMGDKADKAEQRVHRLVEAGFAVASVNYRLSDEAIFPAQLHDAKGAIRFLRAHAAEYGLDPGRLASFGVSAGGHLAALVGLTANERALEGEVGQHLEQSSGVGAVVDWYGPSDLLAVGSRSPLEAALAAGPGLEAKLLGASFVSEAADLARTASPLAHVHRDAPPFLLMHGDRDHLISPSESATLHGRLVEAGVASTMAVLGGAGHDDPRFDEPFSLDIVTAFLRRHLT